MVGAQAPLRRRLPGLRQIQRLLQAPSEAVKAQQAGRLLRRAAPFAHNPKRLTLDHQPFAVKGVDKRLAIGIGEQQAAPQHRWLVGAHAQPRHAMHRHQKGSFGVTQQPEGAAVRVHGGGRKTAERLAVAAVPGQFHLLKQLPAERALAGKHPGRLMRELQRQWRQHWQWRQQLR